MSFPQALPIAGLPPADRYNKETWEATIKRDYFDHMAESAAYLLDEAIKWKEESGDKPPQACVKYLAEAAWWLEVTVQHDLEHKPHVLKNLGLVYLHMVRVKGKSASTLDLPRLGYVDVFEHVAPNVTTWFDRELAVDWKTWGTTRYVRTCLPPCLPCPASLSTRRGRVMEGV